MKDFDDTSSAIRQWREEPVTFCRQVLLVDEVDDWQEEVLVAATQNKRIALKASKGPGKSTVLAWLMWWFLLTRPHPKVVATSITGDNLRDGLWAELSKWQKRSPLLKEAFRWQAERISSKEHPETWFASARQWAHGADPAKQADTLAGIHADNVLFVVDEAGGIPDAVVAAAEAGLANADKEQGREALLAIAGNPTELSGPLYRACTKERALWWVKEISGDPDDPKRAKRVSREWALEQKAKWGATHPFYMVNVLGKFPPGQSNTLFSVDEVNEATRREVPPLEYADEVKILGVDVARFGDDRTVLLKRQGRACFLPDVYRNLSTMETAGRVASVINDWQPDAIFIDQTGVGGGVVDRLKELGYQVFGVDSAGKPVMGDRYLNRRVEMWDTCASWIRKGGRIPSDGELVAELTAPTFKFNSNGAMQLESKADLKKRGLPSPDIADALCLTFAAPVANRAVRERLESRRHTTRRDYDPLA